MRRKTWPRVLLVAAAFLLIALGALGKQPPAWGREAWYQNHLRWQEALDRLQETKKAIPLEDLVPFDWDSLHLFNAKHADIDEMQSLLSEPFPHFEKYEDTWFNFRDIHLGAHFLFLKDGQVVSYGFDPQQVYRWPYNFPLPLSVYRANKPYLEVEIIEDSTSEFLPRLRRIGFFIGDAEPPPPAWEFMTPSSPDEGG